MPRGVQASDEAFRQFLSGIEMGALMLDVTGKVAFVNDHLLSILGRSRREMIGHDWLEYVPAHERAEVRTAFEAAVAAGRLGSREDGIVTRSGTELRLAWNSVVQRDSTGEPVGIVSIVYDVTGVSRLEPSRALLAAAVEQTADAVVVTNPAGDIVFVNPAFELASGYGREEAVGLKWRFNLVDNSRQPSAAKEMWSILNSGGTWRGELAHRRRDGSDYTDDATVSPVFDAEGKLSAYMWLQRDVTHVRAVEAELTLAARVRAVLGEATQSVDPTSSLEDAGRAVCDGLASLPGIDVAYLVAFLGRDAAIVVASRTPAELPLAAGSRVPRARARHLQQLAASGPWGERSGSDGARGEMRDAAHEAGVQALAFGPILHGDAVGGMLVVGTRDTRYAAVVADTMPALIGFGSSANLFLVERLESRRRDHKLCTDITAVLARSAFDVLFQPIVDLVSGETVAYEALTRFHSKKRPEACFVDAWSVGMGIELELATLEAAVTAARELPAGRWLDVNVSPRLLEVPDRMRRVLERADRPIVIEITEHEPIVDYAAVRAAVVALGPEMRLAVDDAGVGIANFGHIIELRPDFVKLDTSLVQKVNVDPGRQALIVAMRHFARTAGWRVVAEGIETDEEARTLRQLGVDFGQGFWLGQPQPAAHWAAQQDSRGWVQ